MADCNLGGGSKDNATKVEMVMVAGKGWWQGRWWWQERDGLGREQVKKTTKHKWSSVTVALKSGAAAEELTRLEEHAQVQAAPRDCTTASGASAKKQGVMWLQLTLSGLLLLGGTSKGCQRISLAAHIQPTCSTGHGDKQIHRVKLPSAQHCQGNAHNKS